MNTKVSKTPYTQEKRNSNPSHSAIKEGFENEFQLSGGQLIAAGLDSVNSLIFCKAENGNKSLSLRLTDETPHPFGCGVFVPVDGFKK